MNRHGERLLRSPDRGGDLPRLEGDGEELPRPPAGDAETPGVIESDFKAKVEDAFDEMIVRAGRVRSGTSGHPV